MKIRRDLQRYGHLLTIVALMFVLSRTQAEAKRLLVVTTTAGYRHSSIPVGEAVLRKLAQSNEHLEVEFLQQPPDEPKAPEEPQPPDEGADAGATERYRTARVKYEEDLTNFQQARAPWESELRRRLRRLDADGLRNYDALVFANTSGDLPVPDLEALLDWVQSGHAFIGMHAASDTLKSAPAYIEMLGGRFKSHGAQVTVSGCMP